jgi:hypothetical protein
MKPGRHRPSSTLDPRQAPVDRNAKGLANDRVRGTGLSEGTSVLKKLDIGRRASVTVWMAVMLPGMIMAIALGVEAGGWAAAQVSVQRSADFSAMAGAMNYLNTTNKQAAATYAARVAQLNGAVGTTTPAWNSTSNTVTDGQITAQVIAGLSNATDTAFKITVTKSIAPIWPAMGNAPANYSVSGISTVELVTTSGGAATGAGAAQPCLLALSTSGQITGTGSTYINMPNCSIRSNGTITFSGAGTLTTNGIFAAGAISIPNWFSITGTQYPNDGTITDPYASDTALQNALTTAAGLTGTTNIACGSIGGVLGTAGQYTGNNNCNGTNALPNGGSCSSASGVVCTLYPGNYGSFIVSAGGPYTFNLQPGLYLFNGAITLTQNTTTTGSAVTIITTGQFTGSNTFNFTITAPTVAQAATASPHSIPGIALAGSSSSTTTVSGAVNFVVDGVVYFPNAVFDSSGSTSNNPGMGSTSGPCLEIIASSIYTSGYSDYNSNCSSLGATSFSSVASSTVTTAQIVH